MLLESAASRSRKGRASRAIRLPDPAVGDLVEARPMIGRVGSHATPIAQGWSARTRPIGRPTWTLPR